MQAQESTMYLFSHGIADSYKQAYNYTKTYEVNGKLQCNQRYIFDKPVITFNYPDATECFWRVNFWKTSLGQKNEIDSLNRIYQHTINVLKAINTQTNIVLFGLSRGASTAINFVALHKPSNIKALILESPYDHAQSVAQNIIERLRLQWIPGGKSIAYHIMSFLFAKHCTQGPHPIDLTNSIPKELPILIICSKQDTLVPINSSINIYKKLKETGHTNVYLLILDHGKHGHILDQQDGEIYQSAVHAFYKKYDLPHEPSLANQGKSVLLNCTPIV